MIPILQNDFLCINNLTPHTIFGEVKHDLTIGKIYTQEPIPDYITTESDSINIVGVYIKNDCNKLGWYPRENFKSISDLREDKLNKLFDNE